MIRITILFIAGLMLSINLLSQGLPQTIIMNSMPAPGIYEATESITLQPGFSFTASSGNSLTLRIASAASAQGAVIGYAAGGDWIGKPPHYYTNTTFPSAAQLQRLTHVIASDIGCLSDGKLYIKKLPYDWYSPAPNSTTGSWNGSKNKWIEDLVNRAHAEGVKVSICVGGEHFVSATSSTYLNTFVANIVNFVNLHELDGVDINWEYPSNANEWNQCVALLNALKDLQCKRISIALRTYDPIWNYPSQAEQIWDKVDAIHLMTYDDSNWNPHSNAADANDAMDTWATWGIPKGLDKEKLFIGCAFYGLNYKYENGNIKYDQWGNKMFDWDNAKYYADGTLNMDSPGDNPSSVAIKVNHCYTQGYGGVFIWELGQDLPATDPNSLLNKIWDTNDAKGGYSIATIYLNYSF